MSLNEAVIEDAALEWFRLRAVRQAQGFGEPRREEIEAGLTAICDR
jgi:hypothetical protein